MMNKTIVKVLRYLNAVTGNNNMVPDHSVVLVNIFSNLSISQYFMFDWIEIRPARMKKRWQYVYYNLVCLNKYWINIKSLTRVTRLKKN